MMIHRILQVWFVCICDYIYVEALPNLALGKPAYQIDDFISPNYNFIPTADLAVDGNRDGTFQSRSCSHTDPANETKWWKVNLENIYRIDKVVVYNRDDCCIETLNSLLLWISFDDINYTLKDFYPGIVNGSHTFHLASPTFGRWVKLMKEWGGILLCEVEVYGEREPAHFGFVDGQVGTGAVIGSSSARSQIHCIAQCKTTAGCYGVNYDPNDGMCEKLGAVTSTYSNSSKQLYVSSTVDL